MWANLVKRFDLRRLWTDDAPEYADLDLALADGLVLIPTLRPDVIERYERTTGDLELDIPRPRLVALDLAENNASGRTPRNSASRSGGSSRAAQDDRAFVDFEAEQPNLVAQGPLKPVGQLVAAGCPDDAGELGDRVGGHGDTGEHHAASIRVDQRPVRAGRCQHFPSYDPTIAVH